MHNRKQPIPEAILLIIVPDMAVTCEVSADSAKNIAWFLHLVRLS